MSTSTKKIHIKMQYYYKSIKLAKMKKTDKLRRSTSLLRKLKWSADFSGIELFYAVYPSVHLFSIHNLP